MFSVKPAARFIACTLFPPVLFMGTFFLSSLDIPGVASDLAHAQVGGTGGAGSGVGGVGGSGSGVGGTGGAGSGVGGTGGTGSGCVSDDSGGLKNPLRFCSFEEFLQGIISSVIYIVFPIIVLFMIYAAFKFVAAQGNDQKLQEARRTFLWTLIGSLIILGAWAIAEAIKATVSALRASM